MDMSAVLVIAALAFAIGIAVGHWIADYRRARVDASRVMRTRSNYRRGRGNQK